MKFAYFYASSPEIDNYEDLTLPPQSAILSLKCDEFPQKVSVALNVAVIGLDGDAEPADEFSLEVDIYCEDEKVESYQNIYEPFRVAHVLSSKSELASRYSFIDTFMAQRSGIYTFVAHLYNGSLPHTPEDREQYIDKIECSVIIAKDWR